MDPIARIHKLDRRRVILVTYSRRIRLARALAPAAERRMQQRLDARFIAITRERRQLLEIIKADPVLRKRFFDYEEAVLKKNKQTDRNSSSSELERTR